MFVGFPQPRPLGIIAAQMESSDDVRGRLGHNVRELRVRSRMTQNELSERSGLSMKFIGEVERGVSNPSIDSIAAIARALNADITELFGTAGRAGGTYDASRRHFALVRDAQEKLASAIRDWQSAALGRVSGRKRRSKIKDRRPKKD